MEFMGSLRKPERGFELALTRELTEEDLIIREALGAGGVKAPRIKSLRATHHKLAQCLALGLSDAECSASTGYSPSRISILKADPAFRELLAFYEGTRKDAFIDVQQRMAGFAVCAVEVLQERLEENPEAFSNKDLNNLIKTTADRGGHSPVRKSEHKSVILDAAKLAELKAKVEESHSGQVRRINQVEESKRVQALMQRDFGASLGSGESSAAAAEEPALAGEQSHGDGV